MPPSPRTPARVGAQGALRTEIEVGSGTPSVVVTARNSIFGANAGGTCATGTFVNQSGGNVTDDPAAQASCGMAAAGDRVVSSVGIASLGPSTGPLATHALTPGSPAINAGSSDVCPGADARNVTRPQGGTCDAGAVEARPDLTLAIVDSPDPVPAGQPLTYTLTVSNIGIAPSVNVSVVNALPDGVAYLGGVGCSADGTCSVGSVGAGQSKAVTVVAQGTVPGLATDSATVGTSDMDLDPDNNDASTTTLITDPLPPGPQPAKPGGCTITGSPGPDRLRGTPGPDRICGLGGRDVIIGLGGCADILIGGAGRDRLIGGGGGDLLKGGRGRDDLRGGRGADTLRGGSGRDALFGGPGRDKLNGGRGIDTGAQARQGSAEKHRAETISRRPSHELSPDARLGSAG